MSISKEAIKRIAHDIKQITKSPLIDQGIYYKHDEDNILQGYVMIIGPQNTPYENGLFFFDIEFPLNYPHSPPKVKYLTNYDNIRFNPNLYRSGKVCISILNTWRGDSWTSSITLSSVLLHLCTLLNEKPILNEPGILETHMDFNNYNEIIRYKTIECSLMKQINEIDNIPHLTLFKDDIIKHFINNIKNIRKNINVSKQIYPNKTIISTNLYKMECILEYNKLYNNINKLYRRIK